MFKDNPQTRQYYEIIKNAQKRGGQYKSRYLAKKHMGYVEGHHIIPSSIGGTNDHDNLVWLYPQEHMQAHLLLTEMCENEGHRRKMLMAAVRMINPQDNRREREQIITEVRQQDIEKWAQIRIEAAKAHSKHMSETHSENKNPFYGKTHSVEARSKQKEWTTNNNPMHDPDTAKKLGEIKKKMYEDNPDLRPTGTKNPRYDPTVRTWHNDQTGEIIHATRLEMIQRDPKLRGSISSVITGKIACLRGWRIISY